MANSSNLPGLVFTAGVIVAALFIVVRYVVPLFRPRCPDCSRSLRRPVACETVEQEVYRGGFDDLGQSLPPIVERSYVCARCGYRKVLYAVMGSSGAGNTGHTGGGGPLSRVDVRDSATTLNVKELEWLQKVHGQYEAAHSKALFHSYDEWRAFFDHLKSMEREEHGPRANGS